MSLGTFLEKLDRRWIFLVMGLLVLFPLLFPLALPLFVSSPVQSFARAVDSIPNGSKVLNVTNTVKVRGPITTVGSSTFGQIRVQSGFQRLTQLTFRVTF